MLGSKLIYVSKTDPCSVKPWSKSLIDKEALTLSSSSYGWYPRKLPLLAISRFCVMQGFEIVGLIFCCTRMHHEYFLGHECASVFLIFAPKYRKYTINLWRVLYAPCASAVISPLRQYSSIPAKTRLKNVSHVEAFYYRNWYQYWGHCWLGSLKSWEAHHSPSAKPQIEVSIYILSRWSSVNDE